MAGDGGDGGGENPVDSPALHPDKPQEISLSTVVGLGAGRACPGRGCAGGLLAMVLQWLSVLVVGFLLIWQLVLVESGDPRPTDCQNQPTAKINRLLKSTDC